jgi:hypothetical protein
MCPTPSYCFLWKNRLRYSACKGADPRVEDGESALGVAVRTSLPSTKDVWILSGSPVQAIALGGGRGQGSVEHTQCSMDMRLGVVPRQWALKGRSTSKSKERS